MKTLKELNLLNLIEIFDIDNISYVQPVEKGVYYTVQKSINRKKEAPDNLNYLKRVEIKLDYEWSNRTLGDVIQNKASINFFNVEKQVQKEFLAVLKQRLGSSYAILKHKLFNDLFYIEYRKLGLAN